MGDDNWQNCDAGTGGNHYHDDDGNPIINYDRFPDMKNMTDHAHSLGLTSGWYRNNCICSDHKMGDKKFYQGDVNALRNFGFDSYKLDGCGAQTDMQLWDDIIKGTPAKTGRSSIMVENCHWGSKVPFKPNATWCPWNLYRTSGDVRARYSSVVGNLQTAINYAAQNLSTPGCWAYPDMLEVGCFSTPFSGDTDLTVKWSDVPGLKCQESAWCYARDIWNHKDLGSFVESYTAKNVAAHDAVFLMVTP